MRKVSLDVWIQLIGLLSVLGGLVFVGLQMRQSQTIALAAQQQARMQVFVEAFSTLSEQYRSNRVSCKWSSSRK